MRFCGLRFVAVALTAATLAACARSAVVTDKSASLAASRTASTETRTASVATASVARRRVAVAAKKHTPFATRKRPADTQTSKRPADTPDGSHGIASFYAHGTQTASGEKFDPTDLTAAHRTLPFGTRLRVTNVATGQSVTVRVNDRGPFIPGRVVDVSQSAAETLGLVGRGIAKVKLDVVE
jgi:rare lipoprotein A